MSKERPILFSSEMVRAILDGRKTQTRRVLSLPDNNTYEWSFADVTGPHTTRCDPNKVCAVFWSSKGERAMTHIRCPYGKPGDRLWVRERTRVTAIDKDGRIFIKYEAREDDPGKWLDWPERLKGKKKFGCLPYGGFRESSRINLEITNVRVERLQDISGDDVVAEGIDTSGFISPAGFERQGFELKAAIAYAELWNEINGKKHPWSDNPYVWVIEFKKI